jgi:hypothetical protein
MHRSDSVPHFITMSETCGLGNVPGLRTANYPQLAGAVACDEEPPL